VQADHALCVCSASLVGFDIICCSSHWCLDAACRFQDMHSYMSAASCGKGRLE
jgi:hypothetical protein